MPTVTELTISFGGGGNSLGYLGGGWARAEDNFTWAIGQESHLLLPLPPGQEPREFVLMMSVIPFVHPPALSTQRLIVSIDETTIGMTSLSRPTVLAWRIPVGLIRRAERTLVTLWHPDAARPKDLSAADDDRDLAFSVSEVKVFHLPIAMAADHPVPPNLSLGGMPSPGFGTHPGIDLKEWVTRRTNLTLPELAASSVLLATTVRVRSRATPVRYRNPWLVAVFGFVLERDVVRGISQEFEGIGEPDGHHPHAGR